MIFSTQKIHFTPIFAFVLIVFLSACNINDTALSVLSTLKNFKGDSVNIENISTQTTHIDHQEWSNLLAKYVNSNGDVNYAGFKNDQEALQNYLDILSKNAPDNAFSDAEKLAFWINAYNAFTVKLIIDNMPIESIKNIGGNVPMLNSPWDIKFFEIGKIPFDLNTIEHSILRQQFNEPRIHFAINCASVSCPKLLNEAYTVHKIEQQLTLQAQIFINDTTRNKIISPNEVQLSKIFDWFKSDFTKNQTLEDFINQYAHTKLNQAAKIDYLAYNWNLNKQ